jgi:type II secretory pathway component GspD/PulD (secretin)
MAWKTAAAFALLSAGAWGDVTLESRVSVVLRHADPAAVAQVMTRLTRTKTSCRGRSIRIPGVLSRQDQKRWERLIEWIDRSWADRNLSTAVRVYCLRIADAREVGALIKDLVPGRVQVDHRTNALIGVGDEDVLELIQQIVSELDR